MLLTLLACASNPEGVWLFHISETAEDASCEASVSHNVLDAGLPAEILDEDEWEISDTEAWSEAELFGLVSATDAGFVLLLDGGIYEASDEDEELVFTEVREELEDSSAEHPSGYVWRASTERSQTRTVSLGDGATWDLESSDEQTWSESDSWPDDIGIGATGNIPVGDYLVVSDGAEGTLPASNVFDTLDCTSEPCQLSVSETCSRSWVVRATPTAIDPAEFDSVEPYETGAGL